jgi:DNA primase
MNFSQQLNLIKTLVPSGEVDTRMDCPFCQGTNTLTIKRNNADLLWYCFHASCTAKGNHEGEMTMEQVIDTVVKQNVVTKEKEKEFVLPKSFVSVFSTDKCTDYFKKNHCMESHIKGKASFMYDVKQNRAVFLIKEKEKIRGAVGRGLNSQVYPKWFMYGDKSYPFICGSSDTAVLVEDCASACAVSEVYTGVALMGTSLPDSYIPVLKKKFKKVIVALDRDATTKAFDISNQLRYYMDTEVKILEDDLKYFDKPQIESLLQ